MEVIALAQLGGHTQLLEQWSAGPRPPSQVVLLVPAKPTPVPMFTVQAMAPIVRLGSMRFRHTIGPFELYVPTERLQDRAHVDVMIQSSVMVVQGVRPKGQTAAVRLSGGPRLIFLHHPVLWTP